MSESSHQRTAILVLGMHRSGTSAITRFLSLLGADLPDQLLEAVPDNNESGFWESREVRAINDELLHQCDSRWDDWRALSAQPPLDEAAPAIRDWLQTQFTNSPHFVLKDPRICRLLPVWKKALQAFEARTVAVLALRHPLEVAASLRRRDGFSQEKSLLVWLRHVLDAERDSRDLPRICLPYAQLIEDWTAWPARLKQALQLDWPAPGPETRAEIETFLNPDQRHHQAETDKPVAPSPRLTAWVEQAWAALQQLDDPAASDAAMATLDTIEQQLADSDQMFGPALTDEIRSRIELEHATEEQRRALDARLQERAERLSQVEDLAQQRKQALEQRAQRVEELETLASQRKSALEDRARRLIELEQLASQRKSALEDRARRVTELEQLAGQRKAVLEDRIRKVAELEARAEQRAAQWQAEKAELQERLQERVARVESLEALHRQRRQKISELEQALQKSRRDTLELLRRNRLQELQHRRQAIEVRLDKQAIGRPPRAAFGQQLALRDRRRLWRQARQLLGAQLFDPAWYLLAYPDVLDSPLHPVWHWLIVGWREGRQPNPLFDPHWYLRQCPDVEAAGLNPLVHYIEHGAREGRQPGPLFNPAWYLQRHGDVAAAGLEPLAHYLQHGRDERRQALELFDPAWYLQKNSDVREAGLDPLQHYLLAGGREQRDPGPHFAGSWYLEHYEDVRHAGLNPLKHYLGHGRLEGRAARPEQQVPDRATTTLPAWTGGNATPRFAGALEAVPEQPCVLVCAHAANGHLFGGERSFVDILVLLESLPCNVYVVVPALNPEYIEQIKPHCCEVAQISYRYWQAGSEPEPQAIDKLQAYMVSRRIELVHVNTIVVREPLVAARQLGIASLVHVRESVHDDAWISQMMGLTPDELVARVVDSTDAIVANSRHTAEEFAKPQRSFVVPNTFDMDQLDLANHVEPGRLKVGLISSNIPKKGLEDFVQLAKACQTAVPQCEFYLIGPDNEHIQALKKRQAAGELSDKLHFAGYQSSPVDALRLCNVVVNFSHFKESFGRTVAEALAARRPVIVYAHGAPQDLVQDGVSGHVIGFQQWREAIPYLQAWADDPQRLRRMGMAGREFVAERFSRSAGVHQLRSAYEQVLEDRASMFPLVRPARRASLTQPDAAGLKLAYFCWHFPVPSETFVLNELRLLVDAGVDVEVFCRQCPYPDFEPDFPIRWTRIDGVDDLAAKLTTSGRNLVHAHFTYPTVTEMVWPACERAGIPFTFIAHAQDIFKYDNDQRNRVGELASSDACRAVFTLGRFHRDYLLERGVPAEKKLIINPNSIDPSLFPFRPPAARHADAPRRICAIHRLTEKKGLHNLLLAAQEFAGEDYEINIYGYGDEEERLRGMRDELGLDFVHLRGPLKSREEILEVLHQHDLFACPSIRTRSGDMDGIPTVLIEAMAAGTPVITTHVASIDDLVQDGVTGMIVDADDPQALAEGIRRFYRLDQQQVQGLVRNARDAVEERHDARRLTWRLQRFWQQTPVDIVIVSWNNLAELREVVRHLFAHTKHPFHLIICDNASEPDVTEFLFDLQGEHDNITVVHQGWNSLVGPGTNTALAQGQADYAIYVCGKEGFALRDGWETDMVYWMEQHPAVGLAGSLGYSPSYLHGKDLPEGVPLFDQFRNPQFAAENPEREFRHVQGGLFILRRTMFEQIGGFSEAVPHAYTDVEYSYYVESEGWQLGRIPGVLALFNKTVPDIWSRIHEGIKVIHPPRLQDLPLLHQIADTRVHFCNCCQWSGPQFADNGQCPQCGSHPRHRSLYRYLAEDSVLTYRRLPALWVNPHGCLASFWQASFQGRRLTQDSLGDEISSSGRIDTASGALRLIVLDAPELSDDMFEQLAPELHRVLHPEGELLLLPRPHQDPAALLQALSAFGLRPECEARYVSHVLRYDLHSIHVLRKHSRTH